MPFIRVLEKYNLLMAMYNNDIEKKKGHGDVSVPTLREPVVPQSHFWPTSNCGYSRPKATQQAGRII